MDNEVDNVVLSIQDGEGTSTTDYGGDEVPNDCNEDDNADEHVHDMQVHLY